MSRLVVKLCGITTIEDALAAADAGADRVGLNFWPRSPRCLSLDVARAIVEALPAGVLAVGVFVDAGVHAMREAVQVCRLAQVQLHGDESPELLTALPVPAFKALRIGGEEDLAAVARYVSGPQDWFLADARHGPMPGGTGCRIPEALAARAARLGQMLLAGGLGPDNVGAAVCAVRPAGVDVASGVETAPGRKDHGRMRAFVKAAREAAEAAEAEQS